MDLFAGKKLMDEGITAEMLDALTGDIMAPLSHEDAHKVARDRMLNTIVEDKKQPKARRERARRGFANRAEERKARKSVVAQVRRFHRIMDPEFTDEDKRPVRGRWPLEVLKRHEKRRRINVARRQHVA